MLDAARRFHLHQRAHLGVGAADVVVHAVPARCPRQCAAHAPVTVGRIAHRRHGRARLLRALHHRDQQRLCADVEQAFDLHHVVPRRPHDRMRGIRRHRLQLRQRRLQLIGRVLAVDQQPVEAGPATISAGYGCAIASHRPICGRRSASARLKGFTGSCIADGSSTECKTVGQAGRRGSRCCPGTPCHRQVSPGRTDAGQASRRAE